MNISLNHLIISSSFVTFPIFHGGCVESGKKSPYKEPNIIYILADDLGIGDLGCYGQKVIRTPTIDELAEDGMRFLQHYSGSTVSAPSRCSLLTGKHTGHTYIRGNKGYEHIDGFSYDLPLADEELTIAEILKQNNYQTACIGKWGLGGPDSEGHPNNQGFDYFFGYLGQGNAHSYYPQQLFENHNAVKLDGKVYSHDLIVEKALDYIERNIENPFFLYLPVTIPHAELIVPEKDRMGYTNKFPETPFLGKGSYGPQEQPYATYAAMVSRLDKSVQGIIDLLKKKGIYDNTIIMFASDNGVHKEGGLNPDFFNSNGPFRGNKRDLYEGGIRTPFIVSWPAVIPREGRVSYHASAFWDLLPTVCEIIGTEKPQNIDGISFLPQLTGNGEQQPHASLYFEFHEQGGKQALLKDGWKLIRLNVNKPQKAKLELYNYYIDSGENANVVLQYPEKVEELSKLMDMQRTENEYWSFTKGD
ncbi:arylsulfatase [uncultured Proteiniphilum sp.]|jgi:arylsulfatase A-like enzyme|uniref:arylsulfatase n=1 Tax=uncultured Proteiniphilum sp. TaxID=497637 RepID=UPI002607F267|nr:arylsulfatase [uncultured Proteiniphilum sp.]